MPFATVGDIQMFYQDVGVPGGRPVVMIHGFTGTGSSDWAHQIHGFRSGFRLGSGPADRVRVTMGTAGAARRLTSG